MPYSFAFHFSPLSLWLLGAMLMCAVGAALAWMPLLRVARLSRSPRPQGGERTPMISVIACGYAGDENLERFISDVMEQDYPDFELIIVNNTTPAYTRELMERYESAKGKLYMTFIPPESRHLSLRKLAITLGMKAAKGEYVLLTATNCRPPGNQWLSAMAARLADPEVKLVLGHTHTDEDAPGAGWRRYRDITDGAAWISAAGRRHAYRGDGLNMIVEREMFLSGRGFSSTAFIPAGDDDVFVAENSTASNTSVCLDPEAELTADWGRDGARIWKAARQSRRLTRRFLPVWPRLLRCFGLAMRRCVLLLLILTAVLTGGAFWPVIAAVLIAVLLMVWQTVTASRAARAMHIRPLGLRILSYLLR